MMIALSVIDHAASFSSSFCHFSFSSCEAVAADLHSRGLYRHTVILQFPKAMAHSNYTQCRLQQHLPTATSYLILKVPPQHTTDSESASTTHNAALLSSGTHRRRHGTSGGGSTADSPAVSTPSPALSPAGLAAPSSERRGGLGV